MAKSPTAPKTDEASAVVEQTAAPATAETSAPVTALAESSGSPAPDAPVEVPADLSVGGPAIEDEQPIPLVDWCSRLAERHRQSHAITAFHDEEVREGREQDLPTAYLARFNAMMQRPAL
jgi:hypothetical protein